MRAYLSVLVLWVSAVCHIQAQHVAVVNGSRPQGPRFTENKGQWHPNFLYRADIPNGNLRLEKNAFYFFMYLPQDMAGMHHPAKTPAVDKVIHWHSFKEEFLNANPEPVISGKVPYNDYANFFIGNDPARWASHVNIYGEVLYHDLYPGIDLKVYSRGEAQLKYDFVLQPNADVKQVEINYNGVSGLKIDNGALLIKTTVGEMVEQKPFAYQMLNGTKTEVRCRFILKDRHVSFEMPDGYDKSLPLVIDPNIIFASYTGSTADNWGYTATYDQQGDLYLGGYVNVDQFGPSSSYPTTPGAFQTTWGGGNGGASGQGSGIGYSCDMGITKFNPTGTQLIYSTYIGGSDNETPNSLIVDAQGNLSIYGVSYSSNYPTTGNAYDRTYNGNGDIVITKLNASGTALVGSTFIGGSQSDGINYDPHEESPGNLKRNYGDQNRGEINIDGNGNIYVASCTMSSNFPTTGGAVQTSFGGGLQDGCAFKLNNDCSQLIWSTYLGGSADDACYSIDLGPGNVLYVAGGTMSSNFPTVAGSLNTSYMGGNYDGFVACINATGSQLISSTFIGTTGQDQVYAVKLDLNNNVYILGQTDGQYPVVNAAYSNPNSGQFIVKMNPSLSSVVYSTVFGNGNGRPNISPTAFLVDTCENVYVAGWGCTSSSVFSGGGFGFPANDISHMRLTADAYQTSTDGNDFYFFVMARDAQGILYGSYFGGAGDGANTGIEHVDGGTSRFDPRGIIYEAICAGCGGNSLTPTTPGVWSPTNQSGNCNELGLKMEFHETLPSVTVQAYPRATGCVPLTVQFHSVITNATSMMWYLGDGTTSTQTDPVHTYTDTGVYHIMLVAANACHLSDTGYTTVTVRNDSISANFTPNIHINCDSERISLSAALGYPTTHYLWNFGDNKTDTSANVSHVYANPGTYNITLIVTDSTKCNLQDTFAKQVVIPGKVRAAFTTNGAKGCVPFTVDFTTQQSPTAHYYWSFGDSTTGNTAIVSHTYTYQDSFHVRLVVIDSSSCNFSDTAYAIVVAIDSYAHADFNFVRTFYGCDSVRLTAWTTYKGEDSQSWDFGDGTVFNDIDTVSHTYSNGGTFTLTHYITDNKMVCRMVDSSKITVSLSPLNVLVTIPDTGGCVPFTANFIGSSALLSTHYYWFFGDGDSASGSSVSHVYQQTGAYHILVVSTDTNACVGLDTTMAMVNVINDSVHAMFGINILHDCDSNLVVDLLNQSINAVQYTWTFGDGTSSTQTNPGHTYTMPATYTIKLVAIDTTLCHPVDSLVRTVTLKPNTVLDFIAADVCRGTAIQFSNLGNPNAKFIWYFADGTISGQYSPSHLYPTPGSFDVKLTMIDTSTCNVYDTAQHTVQVYQQPVAGFLVQGDTFRFDKPVHFTNNSIYYDHLFWNFGDGDTIEDETNPTHTYENIGDMNVCIIASNSVCADTMCKNIFISFSALIGVPNAFSPNGDGVNDVVKVEGKGIVGLVFRIYNRWGEKVFETHDKNEGWNGIYKGILQEMDVYTYAVEATLINGQTVPLKGNITLLR